MSLELEIRRTNGHVQRRELPPGKYVIGRDAGQIILNDPQVSTRHAQLTVTQRAITLTDLGSTNGTFDGSTRLTTPTLMLEGRPLRIGGCTLTLVPSAAESPAPPSVRQTLPPRPPRSLRTVLAVAAVLGVVMLSWSVWRAAGQAGPPSITAGSD
jgi:DNA segregation ATPase FtsK/SpoIIIE, S-DNA-T family